MAKSSYDLLRELDKKSGKEHSYTEFADPNSIAGITSQRNFDAINITNQELISNAKYYLAKNNLTIQEGEKNGTSGKEDDREER